MRLGDLFEDERAAASEMSLSGGGEAKSSARHLDGKSESDCLVPSVDDIVYSTEVCLRYDLAWA